MEVVPFVREGLGNSSYLVRVGGEEAILVDPDRSADRYLEAASVRGWTVASILETHLHADFVTGSLEAAHASGAVVHLPKEAGAAFSHRGLVAGERFEAGEAQIQTIASPGHTPEHLAYVVRSAGEPPLLFSGGALIVGGAARTDLVDARATDRLTRAQFHTLRGAFADLPDETRLLPTHGGGSFCSVGSATARTSTLGEERRSNPLLAIEDEDEFARWFPSVFPGAPSYFFRMREANRVGPRLRRDIPPPASLDPGAFEAARGDGALVVDLRVPEEYAAGHIPASLSIAFRDRYAVWLGWLVPPEADLLFVMDGVSLDRVVDESLLVGYEGLVGYLDGGIDAWPSAGLPIARTGTVDPLRAQEALLEGAVALDVREANEHAAGHVPGALHVPLGELPRRLGEVPTDRPVLSYCGVGERATTALSILERAGFGSLLNLRGGFIGWRRVGLPVQRP